MKSPPRSAASSGYGAWCRRDTASGKGTQMSLPAWVSQPAYFSSPRHRVWLRREIAPSLLVEPSGPLGFILHNPSIAAEIENDPTAIRGMRFAQDAGAREMIFVNAATGIATAADDLADMEDPIGPMADEALRVAAEYCLHSGGKLVAAWGCPKGKAKTKRLMQERFEHIKALGLPLHVLRVTASGHPEHPLYLPANLRPVPWRY